VGTLPGSEQEVRTVELNESRNCTISTRLYLLGYMKRDNHSPEIDSKLRDAIHRFQSDAGLMKDSWVGRQTWTALQELVGFEYPSNLSQWFKKISTWVKNAARLSYQYALRVFPIVMRVTEITKSTVTILIHKTFAESDVRSIVINRDRDYDYRIYINSDCEYEKVKATVTNFSTKVKFFNTGMRVLSLMVSSLIAVISSVPLAGGWFGLILVLLKIYSRFKGLGGILYEEQAFLAVT